MSRTPFIVFDLIAFALFVFTFGALVVALGQLTLDDPAKGYAMMALLGVMALALLMAFARKHTYQKLNEYSLYKEHSARTTRDLKASNLRNLKQSLEVIKSKLSDDDLDLHWAIDGMLMHTQEYSNILLQGGDVSYREMLEHSRKIEELNAQYILAYPISKKGMH